MFMEGLFGDGDKDFSQTAMVYFQILYGFWINTRGLYDIGRKQKGIIILDLIFLKIKCYKGQISEFSQLTIELEFSF